MKRSLTVSLVALLLAALCSHFAVNSLAGNPKPADPVQTIRQQYGAVNKGLKRYKTVKKELSGFSLEGGELIAYFDGPAIVKIVATHFGEGGKATEEYYYWKGKLIFVYRKDYRYDRPLSGKVVGTQENRFYFQNDQLFLWINVGGKPITTDAEHQQQQAAEYQEKQAEYLGASTKFVNGARSKDPTIEAEPE